MTSVSAGLLLFRRINKQIEVLLAHPGGPYWRNKDDGAWTIPKGEFDAGHPLEAAKREFAEETNLPVHEPFLSLGTIKQKGGKVIHAWATEGEPDLSLFKSNTFELEWPPESGRTQSFPEVDRVQFFSLEEARSKMNPAQTALLNRLQDLLTDDRRAR